MLTFNNSFYSNSFIQPLLCIGAASSMTKNDQKNDLRGDTADSMFSDAKKRCLSLCAKAKAALILKQKLQKWGKTDTAEHVFRCVKKLLISVESVALC